MAEISNCRHCQRPVSRYGRKHIWKHVNNGNPEREGSDGHTAEPWGRGRHGNHARGSTHPRWNQGRMLSSHGYVLVRVGPEHPLAFGTGYAYEHELVWIAAGRQIPPGHVVHHRNEEKDDNRLFNLELLTRSEHAEHHNAERERNDDGQFVGKKPAGRTLDGREWNEMPQKHEETSRSSSNKGRG